MVGEGQNEDDTRVLQVSKSRKKLIDAQMADEVIGADTEKAVKTEITKVETRKAAEDVVFRMFTTIMSDPSSPLSPRKPPSPQPDLARPGSGGKSHSEVVGPGDSAGSS